MICIQALQFQDEKHYAKMSQVLLRLIAIQPEHENYYYGLGLGVALHEAGKLDLAIEAYQKQLSIKPNHEWAWYNLGMAYWKQGQLALAQQTYAHGLTLNPQQLSALSNDAELALVQQYKVRCLARLHN